MLSKLPQNELISLDYETALLTGEGSVEFYRDDFRVTSMALATSAEAFFIEGEEDILTVLKSICQRPIIVHNLAFEYGVTKCRFPSITLNWAYDTMRLVQCADNGAAVELDQSLDDELEGVEDISIAKLTGLGLSASLKRWLPDSIDHKAEAYAQIAAALPGNVEAIKNPGRFLSALSSEQLKAYNCADAQQTLLLCHKILDYFRSIDFNPDMDHYLYTNMCFLVSDAKIRGVKVNPTLLQESLLNLEAEALKMQQDFYESVKEPLKIFEEQNKAALLAKFKTVKKQQALLVEFEQDPTSYAFNLNSAKHKEQLFCNIMGIVPKFTTPAGAPAFKRSVLGQWGKSGLILQKRGSVLIAQAQINNLLEKASYDGRWHVDLRAAGTTTGRMKGGGGLNVQAMSRREKRLMSGLIADEGKVIVSVDLKAGEPSVIAHFSKDPYYRQAVFGMIGKAPYYDNNNVLLIDDIYLMGMSVSPLGRDRLRDVFHTMKFEGRSFAEQWLINPEVITKNTLKKDRELHKILILGIGYEMGPTKMVESCFEKGFDITMKDAKGFVKAWWGLMQGVDRLRQSQKHVLIRDKALVNFFGYRLVPDKDYKALNYIIQSSVNGIINALCIKFFDYCKKADFITIIHDEILFSCKQEELEEVKGKFKECLDSLNTDLNWSIPITTGWAVGKDWYEAK